MNSNAGIAGCLLAVLLASGTSGCAEKERGMGDTIAMEGEVVVRSYADPTPPRIDPYLIEEAVLFREPTRNSEGNGHWIAPFPMAEGEDGTLYIVDVQQTRADRFDAAGTWLGRFGQRGQGPGEFMLFQEIICHQGRLYVNDPLSRRMTVMNPAGDLLETFSYPRETPVTRFLVPFNYTEGPGYLQVQKGVRTRQSEARFAAFRLDQQLQVVETLVDSTGVVNVIQLGEYSALPPLEIVVPVVGMAPGLPLAWTYGREFRVDFLDSDNGRRWAVKIPLQAPRVTGEMRDIERRRLAQMSGSEAGAIRVDFPEYAPHVAHHYELQWDTAGRLWVPEYRHQAFSAGTPYRYYVFSRAGEWLFRQDLPVSPHRFTGEGFYARRDAEDGTPLVRHYRFVDRN